MWWPSARSRSSVIQRRWWRRDPRHRLVSKRRGVLFLWSTRVTWFPAAGRLARSLYRVNWPVFHPCAGAEESRLPR